MGQNAAMNATIAIPCFNGAAYIGQVIESVLGQGAQQIIVVDDGSTDESVTIIQQYPSVQLVQHPVNQGLATARNTAIQHATGDILIYVDVDAFAAPNLVQVLLGGYTDPAVGGVGGQGIESNIQSLADRWRKAHASQGHGNKAKDVDHLYGLCMSYRLSVLKEIGGFTANFLTNAEDVDVGLRVNAAGYRLRYMPNAQVYHQRTDSIDSLKRAMTAWYGAGYQAKYRNGAHSWKLLVGTLRRLIKDPLTDLLILRDPALARLSWKMGWVKWRALRSAAASAK